MAKSKRVVQATNKTNVKNSKKRAKIRDANAKVIDSLKTEA